MTKRQGRKRAVRRLQAERNLTYTGALREYDSGTRPAAPRRTRQDGAARAEAHLEWSPVPVSEPCACPGPCDHGGPCVQSGCGGLLEHRERAPESRFDYETWIDLLLCTKCVSEHSVPLELPDAPWAVETAAGVHYFVLPEIPVDAEQALLTAGACYLCGTPPEIGALCDRCRREEHAAACGESARVVELPIIAAETGTPYTPGRHPW